MRRDIVLHLRRAFLPTESDQPERQAATDILPDVSHSRVAQPEGSKRHSAVSNSAARVVKTTTSDTPSGSKTDHLDAWSLADALRLDGHTWR